MPASKFVTVDGVRVPRFFYGTAWKEDRTAELTGLALEAGFLAIDTANQRRHYFEEGVGLGLDAFLKAGTKTRDDLFLQTKFTYARGQDHRKPYDEDASYTQQVEQSFESSLVHLRTNRIDSFILHGPFGAGLSAEDHEVWRAMEGLQTSGRVGLIGVSNVDLGQLRALYDFAVVKPRFVQNRCYATRMWDRDVRRFCAERGVLFQGFSLLTANRNELRAPLLLDLAKKYNRQVAQIVFRFSQDIGMIPLTGTSSVEHMKSDLDIDDFALTAAEVAQIENVAR